METIVELYDRRALERLEKKKKRAGRAAVILAAATLAACVLLCCLNSPANTGRIEKATIAVSVLGGWTVIYLVNHPVRERRYELVHAKMLLEGERDAVEGVLEVSRERMRIRGSIRFYPLTLTDGEKKHRSKVIASRAPALRAEEGKRLRLYTVNGYAAAWEER